MNFMTVGSIGAYTRALKMRTLWQQKKDSGNFTQKLDLSGNGQTSDTDPILQQLEDLRENNDVSLANIYAKLNSGKKLTADEMDYLSEKDPGLYQKAKEVEAERVRFEKELKGCRTKEDFQRLKTMHISASLARVNSISNDPAIPKGAKMGLLLQENAKMNAVTDSARKFVDSGKYDKLPTEAELEEAREEKLHREEESARPEKTPPAKDVNPDEAPPDKDVNPDEALPDKDVNPDEALPDKDVKPDETPAADKTSHGKAPVADKISHDEAAVTDAGDNGDLFVRDAYAKSAYRETMDLISKESHSTNGGKAMNKKA